MNSSSLASAVTSAEVLLGDGARLAVVLADTTVPVIQLELDISGVECVDCVMPAEVLGEIVADVVRDELGEPGLRVIVDDPRLAHGRAVGTGSEGGQVR